MSNPSSWFGIHAHDLDRAKAFYESVFDKPLQDVGGNGFRFIIFPADYTQHGTAGMIWHDSNAQSGHGGNDHFLQCPDCAETAEKSRCSRRQTVTREIPHCQRLCRIYRRYRRQPNRLAQHALSRIAIKFPIITIRI